MSTTLFLFAQIVDERYNPTNDVIEIFKTFSSLFAQEQILHNPTLEDLNPIAQTFFLRKAGTERKDISQNSSFNQFMDTKDLFKKLALLEMFSLKTHGTIIF